MKIKILSVIILLMGTVKFIQSIKYHNYSLLNLVPLKREQLQFLINLQDQKYIDVKFWKKPHKLYEPVQIIVNPTDKSLLIDRAEQFGLKPEILLHDLESEFSKQHIHSYQRLRSKTFNWLAYHSLEDIYQWMSDIASKHPAIVEFQSYGNSIAGRDIYYLSINKSKRRRHKVMLEGGIHGNEWLSTEFVTYMIQEVLYSNSSYDPQLDALSYKYHWIFVPIVNPDGFDYSHKTDRLWRKNRKRITETVGVDLNRNFDYNFGRLGTSLNPAAPDFCGPVAFSEPETRHLSRFILKHGKSLLFYFSIHAYGQKIIIPYADRIRHIENYSDMENFALQAAIVVYKKTRRKYDVGTYYDTLGFRISGNSASWVKNVLKTQYVFTIRLRDNGTRGYALPPEEIIPSCEEGKIAIKGIMLAQPKFIRANFLRDGSEYVKSFLVITITIFELIFFVFL